MSVDRLHTLSHEMRSPLTVIVGYTQLLMQDLDDNPEALTSLRIVLDHAEHLLRVSDGIVAEAKEPTIAPTDPWDLAERSVRGLIPAATAKGLRINAARLGHLPPTIQTSATSVRQILSNLLHNAIRYTKEGGVRCDAQLRHLPGQAPIMRYTVTDTGPGMDAAQAARLFAPLSQVHAEHPSGGDGAGLGLWIAFTLAKRLGGTLAVETNIGQGSRFMLDLPCTINEAITATPLGVQLLPDIGLGLAGRRILVADDNPTNRLLMSALLKRQGVAVTLAEDGQAAVEQACALRAASGRFDLVILDIHMPRMHGWDACAHLRELGWRDPIVAVSSNHDISLRQCETGGFDDFLPKPFVNQDFTSWVARLVRTRTMM